ncbi:hypothetical protein BGW37DRAFT_110727 [Umbelopsis sp. PMI_123]|nr:hypothetical protein BGW37DRAFT_110727 [Umbelopsis sp. PMI_123]
MSQKAILITAANGNVGSSLTRRLLDQGFKVNALVRNTESKVASDLEQCGANIFNGDFDDIASLEKASQGIWGVFINAFPVAGTLDELRHNTNVIIVAKEAGAKFGIYMSAILTQRKDELPGLNPQHERYTYWKSKYGTEKALQEAGFDYWTILRPGTFISNFFGPLSNFAWSTLQKQHLLLSPFPPSGTIPIIDPDYIANYAAAAFADPDTFNCLAIDLANEDITLKDFGKLITDITGVQITVDHVSKEEAVAHGMPASITVWYGWIKSINYRIDYDRLDQLPVKRITVAEYLKKNKDSITAFLST